MQMFETFLSSIPKSRSDMVEALELPEVPVAPYMWEEDALVTRSDSVATTSTDECELTSYSTDSSIPLSRAMTDSEIDYGRFRRYQNRSFSDTWDQMRIALDAFPPEYLQSLNSFQNTCEDVEQLPSGYERRRYDGELRQKMERFFQEECQVFAPDDPALDVLEDALADLDVDKIISTL